MSPEWNPIRTRLQRAMHVLEAQQAPAGTRRDVLTQRAERLAGLLEQAHGEQPEDARQALDFLVGDQAFRVDARYVVEVAPPDAVAPLPMAPPFFVGLASMRGEIVPLIDLLAVLGDAPERARYPEDPVAWLVVLGVERAELAFAVERVGSVSPLAPRPHEDAGTALVESAGNEGRLIRGDLLLADLRLSG